MKKKDLEAIVRDLLPELSGFAAKGQLVLMRPLNNVLRGIYFDRSRADREFFVQIFVQPLFVPFHTMAFNLGWRLWHGEGRQSWNADAPHLIADLGAGLKREALPFLSRIQSPRDLADAAISMKKIGDPVVQEAIAYAWAHAGDVEQACIALDQLANELKSDVPWVREMAERARALKSLLMSNSTAAHEQLAAWEAQTVRHLRLEEFIDNGGKGSAAV